MKKRLVEFYVAKPNHTWYIAKIWVPFDLGISVGISRAEGLLWNQLEGEKTKAGVKDISEFVSFIGVYHCWSDAQMKTLSE